MTISHLLPRLVPGLILHLYSLHPRILIFTKMIEWPWTSFLSIDLWKLLLAVFLALNFKSLPLVFHVSVHSNAHEEDKTPTLSLQVPASPEFDFLKVSHIPPDHPELLQKEKKPSCPISSSSRQGFACGFPSLYNDHIHATTGSRLQPPQVE